MHFLRRVFALISFPLVLCIFFAHSFEKWDLSNSALLSFDGTFKYKQALDYLEFGDFDYHYEYSKLDPDRKLAPHDWPIIIQNGDGVQKIAYPESLAIFLALFEKLGIVSWIGQINFLLLISELIIFGLILRKVFKFDGYSVAFGQFLLAFTTPSIAFLFQFHEASISNVFNITALFLILTDTSKIAKKRIYLYLAAGMLFGLSSLFRVEAIISAGVLMAIKSVYESRISGYKKAFFHLTVFSFGFALTFGPYALYNIIFNESIFGNRVYSTYLEESSRLGIISDLIFGNYEGPGRIVVGLLVQMPYIVLIPFVFLFKSDKFETKLIVLHGLITIALTAIAAPNNSWGAGWGIRYFCIATPSLIAGFLLLFRQSIISRKSAYLIASVFLLSGAFYVANYGMKVIKESLKSIIETQAIVSKAGPRIIVSQHDLFYYFAGILIKGHTLLQTQKGKYEEYAADRIVKLDPQEFCVHWSDFSPKPNEKIWAIPKYTVNEEFDLDLNHLRCYVKK